MTKAGSITKTSDVIWQDAQHQVLFQLLDRIAEQGSAREILHQLEFYAESHFALEERYMELLAYPGLESHVAAHDRFREELRDMLRETGEHDDTARQIISTFLKEWLGRHIFGIDKDLEAFMLSRGVR